MRVGVVFPQTEIGTDLAVIRDYVQTAEGLGYTHILIFDHVLGADTKNRPGWRGSYRLTDQFHEPMVFYGYLAAITKLELVTGVIISPQRQTALLAKQAAEVDILTNGHFRLGIGVGWNAVEYESLNENFKNRGRREEEQIEVMRLLWTQPSISYQGRYHTLPEVGLNPLPVQQPIPIWLGGTSDATYRRVAKMADGWLPQFPPFGEGPEIVERVRQYTREAGRDPAKLGMEARISPRDTNPDEWRRQLDGWRDLGATHLSINTMGMGLKSPRDHIAAIERVARELDIQPDRQP
ncbi:MAG TPA: LLM class F420-dependent oxidoreductase [Thermomicrobiaceae bacterium]|nr:LLM class F420-dependent oxidoreductase [Thermomicrobiaceae bacterium]